MNIFNFKNVNPLKSDVAKLTTSIELLPMQQYDVSSLKLALKYITYRFNCCLNPEIDKQQAYIKKLKEALSKQTKNNSNITPDNADADNLLIEIKEIIEDSRYTDSQKKTANEFYKYLIEQLELLPAFEKYDDSLKNEFTQLVYECLQPDDAIKNTSMNDYSSFELRQGAPLGLREYIKKTNKNYLRDYLIDHFNLIKINCDGIENLGYWNGQTYITNEQLIFKHIEKIISLDYNDGEGKGFQVVNLEQATIDFLKSCSYSIKNIASYEYIACLNCVIKVDKSSGGISVAPASPDLVTTYQYLANYIQDYDYSDNNPSYKEINHYLNIISNFNDELKQRILEVSSTILIRGQLFKKFYFLHGASDCGKSKYIDNVLSSLVGDECRSCLPLTALSSKDSRFNVAELNHKLILKCDEISEDSLKNKSPNSKGISDKLKEIVGSTTLDGEQKGIQVHKRFNSDAKIFLISNYFLDISDVQCYRKQIYVPFTNDVNKYALEHPDYKFPDMTKQENKDALFMILLKYVSRLFIQKAKTGAYFSRSEIIDELERNAKFELLESYQNVKNWLTDKQPLQDYPTGQPITSGNKDRCRIDYYYQKFNSYTTDLNISEISRSEFTKIFLELIPYQHLKVCISGVINGGKILLPKEYKGKQIQNYADYKKLLDSDIAERGKIKNQIEENTKKHFEEISYQLGNT